MEEKALCTMMFEILYGFSVGAPIDEDHLLNHYEKEEVEILINEGCLEILTKSPTSTRYTLTQRGRYILDKKYD